MVIRSVNFFTVYTHVTVAGCKIQILNGIGWLPHSINPYIANMCYLVTAQHTCNKIFRLA